jgi:hypothetical protein
MMTRRRTAIALVLAAVWLAASATPALGQTQSPNSPTSGELVEEPKEWDGREIEFTGEAIGEAMARGEYAWLHLNDDAYYLANVEEGSALGGYNSGHAVWIREDLAREISVFGDYHHQGDVVRVRGRFNAACPEHGGDMDIHAEELTVLSVGHTVVDPIKPWKPTLALVLSVGAATAYSLHRRWLSAVRVA